MKKMKTSKKLLAILLTIIMTFSTVPLAAVTASAVTNAVSVNANEVVWQEENAQLNQNTVGNYYLFNKVYYLASVPGLRGPYYIVGDTSTTISDTSYQYIKFTISSNGTVVCRSGKTTDVSGRSGTIFSGISNYTDYQGIYIKSFNWRTTNSYYNLYLDLVNVVKAEQTLSVSVANKTYDGSACEETITGDKVGECTKTYTGTLLAGGVYNSSIAPVDPGTYTLSVTYSGDDSYEEKTAQTQFKISGVTVYWQNFNSVSLGSSEVVAGSTPVYSGATPTRVSDTYYDYTFSGWTPVLSPVNTTTTYTATYTPSERNLSITIQIQQGETVLNSQPLTVTASTTVAQMKALVCQALGTPYTEDKLTLSSNYGGESLTQASTVEELSIHGGDILYGTYPPINGYHLTLTDEICVNFLIDMAAYGAEDGYIVYDYLLEAGAESAERGPGEAIPANSLPTYSASGAEDAAFNGNRILTLEAAPAQIAEEYTIYIYTSDGDLKGTLNTSIGSYCEQMKNHSTYGELMSALLNYGQLANEFFDYASKTGKEYSVTTVGNYKASLSAEELSTLNTVAVATKTEGNATFIGVSYIAQLKPEFKFYFAGTDSIDATVSDDLTVQTLHTQNGVVVKVSGLKASDFGKTFTVVLDGTTITFNGYGYLRLALEDATHKELAQGIFRYAQAAQAIFS